MDSETENHLAKLIMEEAAMLRRRADREGVHVYLAKPTVRVRPNPQFLRATMRSVEQSNRIVEVNEMWRRRDAELGKKSLRRNNDEEDDSRRRSRRRVDDDASVDPSCSGLPDVEFEKFLSSRVKRGRGSVGSRMDEQGPYPAPPSGSIDGVRTKEDWEDRLVGPQLPDKAEWQRMKQDEQPAESSKSKSKKKEKLKNEHKKKKRKQKSSASD